MNAWFIIKVTYYGSFPFYGTKENAKDMAEGKAEWEGGTGTIRKARLKDLNLIKFDKHWDDSPVPPIWDTSDEKRRQWFMGSCWNAESNYVKITNEFVNEAKAALENLKP